MTIHLFFGLFLAYHPRLFSIILSYFWLFLAILNYFTLGYFLLL
jgi:hypothetical protein